MSPKVAPISLPSPAVRHEPEVRVLSKAMCRLNTTSVESDDEELHASQYSQVKDWSLHSVRSIPCSLLKVFLNNLRTSQDDGRLPEDLKVDDIP